MDDMALLREYAARNSEAAFETLVSRRIGFVYSAALRQVRDLHLAEEITQVVFIILAQKAGRISEKTILTGWLFKTTRFAALAQIRADAKRRQREQEAQMQIELQTTTPDLFWEQMSPLLDEALATLGETDRQAMLLRFFENKSLAEVGNSLGTGEDTARKRVSRALEKLHRYFSKRGISSTTAIIAGAISANSVQAAPVAMAKGVAASGSTLTLIQGALKIMAWTKAKTAIVVGVSAILAATTTTVVVKKINNRPGYYKGKSLSEWLVNLDDQHPGPAFDQAAEAIRHIGTNGLPIIISKLKINGAVYHNAIVACYELGPEAKPAIPDLIELLNGGYTRGYIGAALGQIGPDAIGPLIQALTNDDAQVRTEVVSSLGNFTGKDSIQMSNAIPVLIKSLKDKSPFVRSLAATSLGQIANEETTVVPALIESLNDPDFQTRWSVCLALSKFGTRATSAIPTLSAALHDSNADVRGTAAIALVQIEPDNETQINSLMPILIENIKGIGGKDTNFRSTTAVTLGFCGEKAKQAVPALLEAASKTSGYEHQEIIMALKKIDPEAAANAGLK
jgi:RNA polymerase sigma factor (sigma-70 family)